MYLQILDAVTTVVATRLGGARPASPLGAWLMQLDAPGALVASKLLALAIAGMCLWLRWEHILRWANYGYAGLVFWNLVMILLSPGLRPG